MFNNIEQKNDLTRTRVVNMQVMKHCLLRFKETGDEDYFNWAKVFGDWSKKYKKEIEEL